MTNVQLKAGNVPNLRFPGFEGEWEIKRLGEIALFSNGKGHEKDIDEEGKYILINSKFISTQGEVIKRTNKQLVPLFCNQIVLVMSDLPNGKALAKCFHINSNNTYTLNQRICSLTINKDDSKFIYYSINRNDFYLKFDDGVNQTNLKKTEVLDCPMNVPCIKEQSKISSFIGLIDQKISTQNKIIEDLKFLKNIVRYDIFTKITNEATKFKHIKDILNYEQPGKYLVTNTDYYTDDSLIPVLTANKTFILGFTTENFGIYDKGECIIFDDFTMDLKFVNFPFKVKSSAIKILTAKNEGTLKFIFEYLFFLNLSSGEHKRHYISEVELLQIVWPDYHKQNQITNILSSIDGKLKNEIKIYKLLTEQKQYFLTELFI